MHVSGLVLSIKDSHHGYSYNHWLSFPFPGTLRVVYIYDRLTAKLVGTCRQGCVSGKDCIINRLVGVNSEHVDLSGLTQLLRNSVPVKGFDAELLPG